MKTILSLSSLMYCICSEINESYSFCMSVFWKIKIRKLQKLEVLLLLNGKTALWKKISGIIFPQIDIMMKMQLVSCIILPSKRKQVFPSSLIYKLLNYLELDSVEKLSLNSFRTANSEGEFEPYLRMNYCSLPLWTYWNIFLNLIFIQESFSLISKEDLVEFIMK